jgi:cbb3-type cytochrome oxidase subunit 1
VEWFIKAFIRASLLWFAAGIALGLAIALEPRWIRYRPAHAHMNVAGFLTMLVFGVGYQLLPRLFGHPLFSRNLAIIHFFLANLGLLSLVTGFFLQPHPGMPGRAFTIGGGILFTIGTILWVGNLWRTFDAAESRHRAARRSGQRGLPTLGE